MVHSPVFRFGYSAKFEGVSGHVPPLPYFFDDRSGQRLASTQTIAGRTGVVHG